MRLRGLAVNVMLRKKFKIIPSSTWVVDKMFFFRALVFLFLDSISFVLADNSYIGLEQLITNLVTIDNTDLVLISDFNTESQVRLYNHL